MITRVSLFLVLLFLSSHVHAQTELLNERSMYSRVYLREDGQKEAVISSSPVHYNNNGFWEDINTTLVSADGGYRNEANVIRSYFPGNVSSSGKIRLVVNSGGEIFIHSQKQLVLLNDQLNPEVLSVNPLNAVAEVNTNSIRYPEIYPGISDEFSIFKGQIKNNVILNTVPSILNNVTSGYFGFQEMIELPAGWTIGTSEAADNGMTTSGLLILDAAGNPVLVIPAPVIFDHYGLQSDGTRATDGLYTVKQQNGLWIITTLVPVSWLLDSATQYPVSIDPTVTIAGTTGGWQSPNNFVDNPGFVFLGVCCSNLTHRAWIKFNTSSIPDTMCVTNVELQVNVTSVAATSAEGVQVYDVTGAFGPYGGINPAAYTDFGNGYYTAFTITTTGLYGYYSLGATANTLLQAQLPLNWFQVAMRLVNEPSTVYKIISGTTSYLRVTYSPCAPLPVELVSLDATCDNGHVNLAWTTASETNNDYFTVERTTNGIDYEIVGTVNGMGNTDQTQQYSFVDIDPLEGTSYYRLKQTDFNGQSEYFNVIPVSCEDVNGFSVYPNPSSGTFIVEGAQQDSEIIVTDVLGQIVMQTKVNGKKTEIDLSNQLNGIYFIQIISKNGIASQKVIVCDDQRDSR